ncbi:uncharacterized protein LOC131874182 [Cryptomeria japonica]|uniref:uncharacterized protein LOC131874178 n=1 Tax=Cryptomeria japonica TaxID=3369 RepID=UPI0027DA799E|nr:uncharacterized protein LOC131874178 [Cryptomeria japonica]XP_059073418.1 uncharacterized protein LOC131874180 [Cryptomeria japonica]XP_059073420.1 uncharacterized protein LOC131874182 [Cryptomeria japonica]
MRALTSFIILISLAASGAAHLHGEEYLPTTPIPQLVRELISPDDDDDDDDDNDDGKIALNVADGGIIESGRGDASKKSWDTRRCAGAFETLRRSKTLCSNYANADGCNVVHVSAGERFGERNQSFSNLLARKGEAFSSTLRGRPNPFLLRQTSVMGVAIKETLQACERPAEEGENNFCATSLESLVDLSTSKLRSNR